MFKRATSSLRLELLTTWSQKLTRPTFATSQRLGCSCNQGFTVNLRCRPSATRKVTAVKNRKNSPKIIHIGAILNNEHYMLIKKLWNGCEHEIITEDIIDELPEQHQKLKHVRLSKTAKSASAGLLW